MSPCENFLKMLCLGYNKNVLYLYYIYDVNSRHIYFESHTNLLFNYAALLPRRGPHIASHSACPSVRPVIERHVAPPSELQ